MIVLNFLIIFWIWQQSGFHRVAGGGGGAVLKDTENQTKPDSAMAEFSLVWFSLVLFGFPK